MQWYNDKLEQSVPKLNNVMTDFVYFMPCQMLPVMDVNHALSLIIKD